VASSGHLKPGEKGRISVSVDVRRKSGGLTKTVQVFTNDPKKAITTLSVRMFIKTAPVKQATHPANH